MKLAMNLVWGGVALITSMAGYGCDSGPCENTKSCGDFVPAGGGSSGAAGSMQGGSDSGGAGDGSAGDAGATGTSGTGGEAGSGGGNVCDVSAPEAGCETPAVGIFVAPTGDDEDSGESDAPVATFAKGVELAIAEGKPLFVCNATYEENVVLGDDTDGIAIHGGFACPDAANPWTYIEGERAVVAPAEPGYALEVELVENLTLTDLEFRAPDGVGAGESSIAAFVSESENVSLERVKLVAGQGQDGDDGTPAPFVYPLIDVLDGDDASGTDGGEATGYECPSGTTVGGSGGLGGISPTSGGAGSPDHDGAGTAGEGGDVGTCNPDAQAGADGPIGADGASASTSGSVTSSGWSPTHGANGENGPPGQGGGGGAGSVSGGGGGGGAGACGGAGGSGGKAGGSSIALLSFQSILTLTTCELVTADAGDGGDGIVGQVGQQRSEIEPIGGYSGSAATGTACDGGNGGRGGDGGAGAGAAGGVSVGLVFTLGADQAAPVVTDASYTLGGEGAEGLGASTNDGIAGVAQEVLEL